MRKLRISALLVAACMIVTMFAGCGAKKDTTLVTIDGKEMPQYLFEYFVYSLASNYQSQGLNLVDYLNEDSGDGQGTTVGQMLKNQIVETLKTYVACEKLAEENGLALTDEEIKQLEETKNQQIEEAGGRKAFADQLAEAQIQEEAIDDMSYYGKVYEKIYTGLFSAGGKFAPSTEEVVSAVIDGGNARVKHVLVMAAEGDEDYETKRQTADQIQARAAAGEDFEALIAEFNEDPGMDTYTEGYVFDKSGVNYDGSGTMDATFTAESHKLSVGGVSPVVVTSNGFHIIKRLPLDEAYITEHLDTFSAPASDVAFNNKIMEVAEGLTVVETPAYEKFSLAVLLGGTDAAPEAEDDHEGHDHAEDDATGDDGAITLEPVDDGAAE